MENTNRFRQVAAAMLTTTVLIAVAACTGSSSGSPNAGSTNSATQGSNTSAGAATQATTSACTGTQLKVAWGRAGVASGHDGRAIVFTNTSSQACTMQGYPGAAIVNGSTVVLDATRVLNGYIGDERHLTNPPLVTLAPGGAAAAMLESDSDNGQTCYASGSGTLHVTPPDTSVTTSLTAMKAGPDGVCSDFEIHPVVPGTLS